MSTPTRRKGFNRWFHRTLGLSIAFWLALMGASGVLVNHPDWIRDLEAPLWLTPPSYRPQGWNQGTATTLVASRLFPGEILLAGSFGCWQGPAGNSLREVQSGLGQSGAARAVRQLALLPPSGEERSETCIAISGRELYTKAWSDSTWHPLETPEPAPVAFLPGETESALITEAGVWSCANDALAAGSPFWKHIELRSEKTVHHLSHSRVELFFDLHSGGLLGLPGRLLMDGLGLLIVFLALGAVSTWCAIRLHRRRKRKRAGMALPGWIRPLDRWHTLLGLYALPLLLLSAGTAFFLRPPTLILLALGDSAAPQEERPFPPPIHKAAPLPGDSLLLFTDQGLFAGPQKGKGLFRQATLELPTHVMGATAVGLRPDGTPFVGSFSGGFSRDAEGQLLNLLDERPVDEISRFRLAPVQVSGYFQLQEQEIVAGWHKGLLPITGELPPALERMPPEFKDQWRMPLWDWAFEVHNCRIFRDWIGNWYKLAPPAGSLLFFWISVTGLVLWWRKRKRG